MLETTAAARRMAVGFVVSVLLTGCQASSATLPTKTPASSHPSTAGGVVASATDPGLTARQRFMILAGSIAAVPADATTHQPYTYLHVQTWARSTTVTAGHAIHVISKFDRRQWRHTTGAGLEITRRLPDQPATERQPQPADRHLFTNAPETVDRYSTGSLRPYQPEPLSTDPDTLATALVSPEIQRTPAGPRLTASGVIGLATFQYLGREQRAATLLVLAGTPDITYQGPTSDLAGRSGMAFKVAAQDPTTTITLIIDARTGELLAAEERISGPQPGLISYILILERRHSRHP